VGPFVFRSACAISVVVGLSGCVPPAPDGPPDSGGPPGDDAGTFIPTDVSIRWRGSSVSALLYAESAHRTQAHPTPQLADGAELAPQAYAFDDGAVSARFTLDRVDGGAHFAVRGSIGASPGSVMSSFDIDVCRKQALLEVGAACSGSLAFADGGTADVWVDFAADGGAVHACYGTASSDLIRPLSMEPGTSVKHAGDASDNCQRVTIGALADGKTRSPSAAFMDVAIDVLAR
jgi:hypothetical protein